MLLSQTSLFGLVCSSQNQTDTWEKSYFYLLTGLSLPSHTHTHTHREKAGCFYQGCIQKSHSVVPKHMDGRPSTFKSLSATMSSARGSWEVFSYILWPSFCLCSHHWHQNATVYGCPSSVHIYLSRGKKKKKEIDFHRMTLLMWRGKRSLQLRWCKWCHPDSHFVFSALISSFGADCLQWAPENWVIYLRQTGFSC